MTDHDPEPAVPSARPPQLYLFENPERKRPYGQSVRQARPSRASRSPGARPELYYLCPKDCGRKIHDGDDYFNEDWDWAAGMCAWCAVEQFPGRFHATTDPSDDPWEEERLRRMPVVDVLDFP